MSSILPLSKGGGNFVKLFRFRKSLLSWPLWMLWFSLPVKTVVVVVMPVQTAVPVSGSRVRP